MSVARRTRPTIELDPDPGRWASMTAETANLSSERSRAFREQMGLPSDRPIVMAGHQGQLWHPGIAAKAYAAQVLAERIGGVAAWLVVDTDDNDPYEITLPTRRDDGGLERTTACLTRVGRRGRKAIAAPTALVSIDDLGVTSASEPLAERLEAALAVLDASSDEHSAAGALTTAALGLLPGLTPPVVVRASRLATTDAFAELASACADEGVRAQYDAAIEAQPGSGMRRLGSVGGNAEIPFWCAADDRWRPATIDDLGKPLMPGERERPGH